MPCIANLTFSSIHISNIDILRCTLISYNRVVTHNVCKMHIVSEYWMFSLNMCFMICFLIDLLSQTISYHSCLNASYCKQYPYDTVQAGRLASAVSSAPRWNSSCQSLDPAFFFARGCIEKSSNCLSVCCYNRYLPTMSFRWSFLYLARFQYLLPYLLMQCFVSRGRQTTSAGFSITAALKGWKATCFPPPSSSKAITQCLPHGLWVV